MSRWRDEAACKNKGIAQWFARKNTPEHNAAMAICASCPVRSQCLQEAQRHEENLRYGVFGGVAPADR
jgi:WhiB family redox-sensing transcriptional regulator